MKPTDPHNQQQDTRPRRAVVRNNLVAIGTAAVMTIYSAGYARTRDAAQRFADADQAARRPIPPVITALDSSVSPESLTAPAMTRVSPAGPNTARAVRDTVIATSKPKVAAVPPPAAAAADSTGVREPARDSSQANSAEPVAVPVSPPADTTAAPVAADSVVRQAMWKDGEYYGWGTSRHGDIQAGVEIKGGRITAAWVQQCLTRYSCNWIAALPGQVVTRQSPEVDYVSGATQSTNAFYYAVVEALARAK